jgi:LPS-assembly lipoprotein
MSLRPLLLFAVLAAPLLSGCGFTPLYAERSGVAPALSSVNVVEPKGRMGFQLREQLDDGLARNRDEAPKYRLALTAAENRTPRGVRVDNVASEYELDLTVGYTLVDNANGRVLLQGSLPSQVTYESADAPYAGLAAQSDAQERAAAQAATQIRLELSRYFATLPKPATKTP